MAAGPGVGATAGGQVYTLYSHELRPAGSFSAGWIVFGCGWRFSYGREDG